MSEPRTPTPARLFDPDTSHAAAESVNVRNATALHEWILDLLRREWAWHGLTHEQIADMHDGRDSAPPASPSGLRTRVSELVDAGQVRDSGRRRKMRSGRNAVVWELT